MAGFKFLEHISDVYIEAWGNSLEEVFSQAVYALFDTITDLKSIKQNIKHEIKVEAEDLESLLFEMINEFLFYFDTQQLMFSRVEISITEVKTRFFLIGSCWGEEFDSNRHPPRTEIKAPTYSLMEIIQKPSEVILRFVVDI